MPMTSFHSFFPRLAEVETRTVTLPRRCLSLPPDTYAFVDLYCDEPGCDCENVLLNVYDGARRHVATINHALGPSGAFGDAEDPGTFLDPLNQQSPLAFDLLALFKEVVRSADYDARLRRHRAMVREKVEGRSEHKRSGVRGGR